MNAATATLPEELEQSFTRLARVLLRGGEPGISRSAASVLSRLATAGPQRVTELAIWESVAQPTMTMLISRLETQGLVARGTDPGDRRAVRVSITPAGDATLIRRREQRAEALEARMAVLDAGERATLAAAIPLLTRLADTRV